MHPKNARPLALYMLRNKHFFIFKTILAHHCFVICFIPCFYISAGHFRLLNHDWFQDVDARRQSNLGRWRGISHI